ncbi:phosphoadenosine phosphosulfate reductase family protein [Nocardia farcinica]|uniref:phosphoadenosine phosphosulfate reductase domain-containing protein n=1 Tax=Nocardia farcinica TaxID=37329 RepID=UPI002456B0F3|nr:phosphoadenosine phosphosulfate reductase family protein [Nocardia farcinica]
MLITSPRHSPADLAAWERLEKYDRRLAATARLDRLADHSITVIDQFAAAGGGYVSTSWGKDSTVLVDLFAQSDAVTRMPVVWVRLETWENPDCLLVRDQMLARHPHLRYEEITTAATSRRWWQDADGHQDSARSTRGGFAQAEKKFGRRHISGVRAEESRIRAMVHARWGEAGPYACRPISVWEATDVFAHLYKHDLPVHPAYGCSFGGQLDRRWLRVSALGGTRGSDKSRAEWEQHYYPEIVGPDAPARKAHP